MVQNFKIARKPIVSDTASVSVFRLGERDTVLGSLETANQGGPVIEVSSF
jgi:hypothetical protein